MHGPTTVVLACALALGRAVAAPAHCAAQDHHQEEEGLHFSHPLITESITPDTKVRVNFLDAAPGGGEVEAGGEYAFRRTFSIEVELPYDLEESAVGNLDVNLKLANYAFEESSVLIGYGAGFGLPTAAGVADNSLELSPFVDAGFQRAGWEFTGWAQLDTRSAGTAGLGPELGLFASALYHVAPRVQAILEYDGHTTPWSRYSTTGLHELTPGIKLRPFPDPHILLGAGLSLPFGGGPYDRRLIVSGFYHF
ncbi:MAG: hypothetical protein P8Z36_00305 [Gemmatimonadota bacterium]|jgi:hypothetical protein